MIINIPPKLSLNSEKLYLNIEDLQKKIELIQQRNKVKKINNKNKLERINSVINYYLAPSLSLSNNLHICHDHNKIGSSIDYKSFYIDILCEIQNWNEIQIGIPQMLSTWYNHLIHKNNYLSI